MRLAYDRYAGRAWVYARAVPPDRLRGGGRDLGPGSTRALDTTEEVDYTGALAWFGLRFQAPQPRTGDVPAWLGARTRVEDGRLLVSIVPRETPAWTAGLNVDDEILAIDDFRVRPDQLDRRLEAYKPGQAVTLLIARRDELKGLAVTLAAPPNETWEIERRPDATTEQHTRVTAWLGVARTAA